VRGFGFLHDGAIDTLFRFHSGAVFVQSPSNPGGFPAGAAGDPMRRNMEAFMMAFDSNLAPIVGQQITRTATNGATADPRITLLEQRAGAGECDLVAKGAQSGEMRGAFYVGANQFITDRGGDPALGDAALRARANTPGQEVTFTCVPPGSGLRIGIDEDGDGAADGDERDAGTDPADPGDRPATPPLFCITNSAFSFRRATLSDRSGTLALTAEVRLGSYNHEAIAISASDSDGSIMNDTVAGNAVEQKGSAFRYHAPKGETGIKSITLHERDGLFKVTLRASHAWAPGAANQDAASTVVTLNFGGRCLHGPATKVH